MSQAMTTLALALALAASPATGGPPFVADDYGRALAEARARGVPLVVDVWAPW
jgi:hypothetical protein